MKTPRRLVLVLTHFYPPEPCAAANRVAALVSALVDEGFDVHVITGVASFPDGVIARADRLVRARTTSEGAVRLTRVWTYASPILSGRNRIANWLSVAIAASLYVCTTRYRYDAIFVTTPPVTLALPAFCALLRYRAKFIVDVRDVFPEVAIRMGYWRENSLQTRIVGGIAQRLYSAADLVFCVTEAARAEIKNRGCPSARISIAANGFDRLTTSPNPPFVRSPGDFVAVFVGNMGLATGLDVLLDAAALLRERSEMLFVIAGDGADRVRLAARAVNEDLHNVSFLGVVSRSDANALLADADVSVVPLHPGLVDSLPTKLFDALALACPVICCANGVARDFVERSGGESSSLQVMAARSQSPWTLSGTTPNCVVRLLLQGELISTNITTERAL